MEGIHCLNGATLSLELKLPVTRDLALLSHLLWVRLDFILGNV